MDDRHTWHHSSSAVATVTHEPEALSLALKLMLLTVNWQVVWVKSRGLFRFPPVLRGALQYSCMDSCPLWGTAVGPLNIH